MNTPPAPTVADAFRAMLTFLRYLIAGHISTDDLTPHERIGVAAGDAIGLVLKDRHFAKLLALRDLVQAAASILVVHTIETTVTAPDMPSLLTPESGVRWIVFIYREGGQAPTTVGLFSEREDAAKFYGTAGAQWSDSYLCEVKAGPRDGRDDRTPDAAARMGVDPEWYVAERPVSAGDPLDRVPAEQRAAVLDAARMAHEVARVAHLASIYDPSPEDAADAERAGRHAYRTVIATHVIQADLARRRAGAVPHVPGFDSALDVEAMDLGAVLPGHYRVACSEQPEHAYDQVVPEGARQARICGACGAVAVFTDDGPESTPRPVAEVAQERETDAEIAQRLQCVIRGQEGRVEALRAVCDDIAEDCDREAFDIREMVRAAIQADDKAAQS